MKQMILFILLCVLLTVQAMAQSENKKEILAKEKKQTTINQELINNPIQPIGVDVQLSLSDYREPKISCDTTAHNINLKLPPLYYGDNAVFPLYKKMFLYLEGQQKQYLNLASYNLAHLALGWRLNSKLNVTGGLLAIKQFSNHLPHGLDRSGVKFNLSYSATNHLNFNMWGQYITDSYINSPIDNLLPQTGVGASMVLNIGGGAQFRVGAEYQQDDKKEKWNYNAGGNLKVNF